MKIIGKKWLSCWLYVMIAVTGIIIGIAICKWTDWTLQNKLFALATALLPLHVLEEWHFPGGFHTMYNLMAKSDCPDRYPMNQMSDMWTNLIGVIFGCVVLAVGVSPFFCVMQLFLCCAEIFGHFSGGIFLKKHLKIKENERSTVPVCSPQSAVIFQLPSELLSLFSQKRHLHSLRFFLRLFAE